MVYTSFWPKTRIYGALKGINNTTEGISELDMSKQIDFQTMGPISNGIGFLTNRIWKIIVTQCQ